SVNRRYARLGRLPPARRVRGTTDRTRHRGASAYPEHSTHNWRALWPRATVEPARRCPAEQPSGKEAKCAFPAGGHPAARHRGMYRTQLLPDCSDPRLGELDTIIVDHGAAERCGDIAADCEHEFQNVQAIFDPRHIEHERDTARREALQPFRQEWGRFMIVQRE